MAYIIGAGGPRDPRAIPLATKRGTEIPNERRWESHPDALRVSYELFRRERPAVILRSLTATYNCMGLVFASRRTWVDTEFLGMISQEDGYRVVMRHQDLAPGDILVYRDERGRVVHVGVVLEIVPDLLQARRRLKVLSKWGRDGEYIHDPEDVPGLLGTPNEFLSERKSA